MIANSAYSRLHHIKMDTYRLVSRVTSQNYLFLLLNKRFNYQILFDVEGLCLTVVLDYNVVDQ